VSTSELDRRALREAPPLGFATDRMSRSHRAFRRKRGCARPRRSRPRARRGGYREVAAALRVRDPDSIADDIARIECRPFARSPLAPLDELVRILSPRDVDVADSLEGRIRAAIVALGRLAERNTVVAWRRIAPRTSDRRIPLSRRSAVSFATRRPPSSSSSRSMRRHCGGCSRYRSMRASSPAESRLVAIARRCGGNPLFAEELLRDAIDGLDDRR